MGAIAFDEPVKEIHESLIMCTAPRSPRCKNRDTQFSDPYGAEMGILVPDDYIQLGTKCK